MKSVLLHHFELGISKYVIQIFINYFVFLQLTVQTSMRIKTGKKRIKRYGDNTGIELLLIYFYMYFHETIILKFGC